MTAKPLVAFTTCAYLKEPYGHPSIDSFDELTELVYAEAEGSPGFIARADYVDDNVEASDFDRDWGVWGPLATPRFYAGGTTATTYSAAQTLSLWRDLESVRRFVYSGLHLHALKNRHTWFRKSNVPTYAIWWVSAGTIPTWTEAGQRIELLADLGPTPTAFDLRAAFDAEGAPVEPRSERLSRNGEDRS
ncbi:DUF3291 domain-containing protein [Amycolatopsis anabasis]|uniref:DUF3291 domain-containing protein n=1 Tax=Amycolatopsis anabasis TaxID=1840409 RepID=UPI00131B913D|nr:DUF3291 domain-containing protein [Amycolatopsis anabasis]